MRSWGQEWGGKLWKRKKFKADKIAGSEGCAVLGELTELGGMLWKEDLKVKGREESNVTLGSS